MPYNKITPEIAARLRACVGEGRFYVKDEIDPNYSHDEMPIYGRHMPDAAVDVETTEEVSAIMKICFENIPGLEDGIRLLVQTAASAAINAFPDLMRMPDHHLLIGGRIY